MADTERNAGRRARRVVAVAAGVLLAALAIWAIRRDLADERLGEADSPLLFILSHDHGRRFSPGDREALAALLSRESGLYIEVEIAATPLDAIEAFGGRADAGLLPLFQYALARKEYAVEAGLQVLREGGAEGYTGVVLVRAEGPVRAVGDLAGKRIAYVDPFSTSGFVFPAKMLADASVAPVPEFAGGHEEALARLRAGGVEAAATYAGADGGDSALRVLVRTDTIPNEPVFFRAGLRPEKKERLAAAIRNLGATPEGTAILAKTADISGFRPIEDEDYAGVGQAIRDAGRSVYEVVPDGLRVESRRRGIGYLP